MKTFTKRMATGAAVVAGIVGLGAGVGFAAAPFSEADAQYGESKATAAGVPGVVTVNDAHADGDYFDRDAGISHLTVAGESVIGRDSDGDWNGTLSALGPIVDMANSVLCPSAISAPTGSDSVFVCAQVLSSNVGTSSMHSGGAGELAGVIVATEGSSPTSTAVLVAPSQAGTFGGCSFGAAAVATADSSVLGTPVALGGDSAQSGCDTATR
jgi:hypothetical protein